MSELRSLIVCVGLPTVVRGGDDLRVRALATALASSGPSGVVGLRADGRVAPPEGVPATWWRSLGVDRLDAASLNRPDPGWMARPGGHPTDHWWGPDTEAALDAALLEARPDVVVLSELPLGAAIPTVRRRVARVVLDLAALHSTMEAEIAASDPDPRRRLARRLLADRSRVLEDRALAQADEVWVCSPFDRDVLVARGGPPVRLVPNVVTVPDRVAPLPSEPRLLFPGLLSFRPNHHAVLRLVTAILPQVRHEVPGATLAVVGAGAAPELVAAVTAAPGAELVGPVVDTGPWFDRAAVVPVPLREGGGTRMKILEALARARPVVATPKAWEGLPLQPGVDLWEAVTDEELVAGIVGVLRDPVCAAALGSAGRATVLAEASTTTLARQLRALIEPDRDEERAAT